MPDRLHAQEIAQRLKSLKDWSYDSESGRDYLRKSFKFKNFGEAWAFMNRVALLAEKYDHHPDWTNSFSKVDILLATHDAGGVSDKDFELAGAIDRFS